MEFMILKPGSPGSLHPTHSPSLQHSLSQCGLCGGRYLDGVITIFYISIASPLESNSPQYSQHHSSCTQLFVTPMTSVSSVSFGSYCFCLGCASFT
ncbi:hypothetical protein ASPVEDRAFT_35941 [Aspergillus versicolor CBS 583.65]|uniref:Uncharacterized protein n=1 Tax=Aspergillus versicolor CBS 583.65 TaxID=1036611 RepID=A0A1L9P4V3_ASPVE|nr:uncharacterized protein ASPVEDRAFT_35941 [Aspergillus versicolor CBS 583.65]OJI96557.1 hypothetical protein ASPVEDRAFT_35941 [Aspergillus versicolor CBS 583.65]